MYYDHFGFNAPAFSLTPDPRFLYYSEEHREALAHLLYGSGEGGGFVLLTGEVGTGKTTICRAFLDQLPEQVEVALILNPRLNAPELLYSICEEFGVALPAGNITIPVLIARLNRYLLEAHAQHRRPVLMIDEAQNLSTSVLEQVRLLTNLETHTHKLLQIFLIGQPELRDKLSRPELRQLSQRITARYHLLPLTRTECGDYICHRLAVAGITRPLFKPAAIRRIHQHSGGIPRLINLLCDRALLGAYATKLHQVNTRIVDRAAREVVATEKTHAADSKWPALTLALLLIVAIALFLIRWHTTDAPFPVTTAADTLNSQMAKGGEDFAVPANEDRRSAPAGTASSASASESGSPVLRDMLLDRTGALLALLELWQPATNLPAAPSPCELAVERGLRCRHGTGGWERVYAYNRPVVIRLRDRGAQEYLLVSSLEQERVTLAKGTLRLTLPVTAVSGQWDGNFRFLWKPPPGGDILIGPGASSSYLEWLRQSLNAVSNIPSVPPGSQYEPQLQAAVLRFQQQRGLPADGLVGPETMIALNSASNAPGIRRLHAEP